MDDSMNVWICIDLERNYIHLHVELYGKANVCVCKCKCHVIIDFWYETLKLIYVKRFATYLFFHSL